MSAGTPATAAPAEGPTTVGGDERLRHQPLWRRMLVRPSVSAAIAAVVVFVFFSVADTTGTFNSPAGIASWMGVSASYGIMACAVALLMISGEVDLSSGVMTGSTGLLLGILIAEYGWNFWLAFAAVVVFAVLIGFTNGMLVTWTRLPSFIVTLATMFVLMGLNSGVTLALTGQVRVGGIDEAEGYALAQWVFGSRLDSAWAFTVAVGWWLVVIALGTWVLQRTRQGNWIYAVGGDANAARNTGVPVRRTKVSMFIVVSLAAALVGTINAVELTSVSAGQGTGFEFYYIIAAVVGGTLMTGGAGSVIGASLGALILGMTTLGIQYAGWDSTWRFTFFGLILFWAVMLNIWVRDRAGGGRR
ncbi:MAG: ABC transporter permease [Candidatus Nanopelagicales bacterium]|jgi:simple sugar transport system permease protein|nr:ABC transporter permease [Candidatus Nanopelagicales bacterium]